MPLTKAQIREKLPWIAEIEKFEAREIQETCHDCNAGLGETHHPNCDVPRNTKTGIQRLQSPEEEDFQEVWVGVMYPFALKIAMEEELFCRDIFIEDGEESIMREFSMDKWTKNREGKAKILWHQPCQKDDEGAHIDVNRAMDLFLERELYKIPLLPLPEPPPRTISRRRNLETT